jgi:Dna[CI] antecedent, DciA
VKPIQVYRLINNRKSLPARLQNQVSEHSNLLKIARQILPQSVADLVVGCVRKNAELVLLTESSALASQLRFLSPVILEAINTMGLPGITSIKPRVIPPPKTDIPRRTAPNIPSLESIETIRGCGNFIADIGLRQSLIILAGTLEKQHIRIQDDSFEGRSRAFFP